jgi:hypothetical protein
VIWAVKKSVVARATRFAFGTEIYGSADANSDRPLVVRPDGTTTVDGAWDEIVPKVCSVKDRWCIRTQLIDD